jgi:hypothetical protein
VVREWIARRAAAWGSISRLEQRLEPWQFRLRRGDDDLADGIDADPVLGAELLHQARTLDAEPRLVRARLVVDPGVDDAAVVAGLVRREAGFLLQDHQPQGRMRGEESPGGAQSHDAAPDHRHVESLAHALHPDREMLVTPGKAPLIRPGRACVKRVAGLLRVLTALMARR